MSLVDVATYRRFTADFDTTDGDVSTALDNAQQRFEEFLHRPLATQTRTEILVLFKDGRLYPKATPIHSVLAPLNAIAQGAAIYAGFYLTGPNNVVVDWGSPAWPAQATVTYIGGFDSVVDGQARTAFTLPQILANNLCKTARLLLHPVLLADVPAGATSVRVGDVAISGADLQSLESLPPYVRASIKPWIKRQLVRGWAV